MYWTNLKSLEQQIVKDELSEQDGLNYLMGSLLVLSLEYIDFGIDELTSFSQSLSFIITLLIILINIFGLLRLYKLNLSLDGKNFVKRFIALNWVINFRLILYLIPISIFLNYIIVFIEGFIRGYSGDKYSIESNELLLFIKSNRILFLSAIMEGLFYLFAIKSFNRMIQVKQT